METRLYTHTCSHLSILLQEDLFSSANSNRAVASNEDDAIELMMYRQSGFQSEAAPAPMSGSQGSAEPLPDELGPAERGEAPPLREVQDVCLQDTNKHQLWLFLKR